ncbi:trans-sulfuration enzyme family protein [Peredibacter starrii]|uniref:Aminotransferase class I/II-fold pyridoxal phosphate-dependent enzyme n=1 Tax=Peredibacter starrii TaxID=28202 RepID=A0AAX4HMI1_9BACT|nr:aminotransferase class I/II-fold pyridoxal phosphate-dependent enzyme [Peredibacter starrii]WPU64119.1 aminotransferase class I/II-fold pyridoxal phosphate-dependent enzyme [Peredibacter starrii]
MQKNRSEWNVNTKLNHPVEIKIPEGNKPLIQPIFLSAKYYPSESQPYFEQFMYSRVSNPTTRQLELTLAEIQKREDCMVVGSGVAALTGTFLGLLKTGDHIISFKESYRPSRVFIRDSLSHFGITSTFLSLTEMNQLESAIVSGKTKLIHFESPSNPNLEIADIEKIISVARKYNVLVSMDGTFAGLHQHTQFDVDIMIHSLTKFGNGHGDVIAGCIAGKSIVLKQIREMCLQLGAALDPHAAYLITRGLKTYMLRYARQTETAQKIVTFLESHPKIKWVRYPNSELARRQMRDMGSTISFEVDPSIAKSADNFCHKLKLIQLAASLGSTESVIAPTLAFFGLDLTPEERESMLLTPYSVRLSVGLEDAEDLIRDLEAALA